MTGTGRGAYTVLSPVSKLSKSAAGLVEEISNSDTDRKYPCDRISRDILSVYDETCSEHLQRLRNQALLKAIYNLADVLSRIGSTETIGRGETLYCQKEDVRMHFVYLSILRP